jgi:hypothetical protein
MKKILRSPVSPLIFLALGVAIGVLLGLATYQWIWLDMLDYRDDGWDYHLVMYLSFGVALGAGLGLTAWAWTRDKRLGIALLTILLLSVYAMSALIYSARQGS